MQTRVLRPLVLFILVILGGALGAGWITPLFNKTFAGNIQAKRTPAPAMPIRPVAVSVINFTQLAASDAATPMGGQGRGTKEAIHPPMSIKEPDSIPAAPPPANGSRQSGPLVVSPPPSQNFLAQEDSPKVGTGTFTIPPDTMGAVGPDKIFVNVNNNYRVQNKATGAVISTVSINTFWASTGASGCFDPRVQYDSYNNRWVVVAVSSSRSANSSVLVGVSATSDPAGTFTLFRFNVGCAAGAPNCDASGEWADFPMLGFNKNWVAIGWNDFQINSPTGFIAGKIMAIDYPTLRTGTANTVISTVTAATNPGNFCMHPATTLSATEDTLYVPVHTSSAGAQYRLHKITGTPAAPVLMLDSMAHTRTGGGWVQPSGDILPQACVGTPGTTCPTTLRSIDVNDAFIRSNVVFRNGNIWYSQTVGLPLGGLTHTGVQWTRIDTTGAFLDGGRIEDPTATSSAGEWYAYSSIAVNANNDVLLGFSNFSATHFANAGYAFRSNADAAGTMRDPVVYKQGEDYYSKDFGGARNRFGDYSHSVVDPTNDLDMWTIQEYAALRVVQDNQTTSDNSRWGTWWAEVAVASPTPTPTPLRIDSVMPQAGRTSGAQQIKLTGAFAGLSSVTMGGNSASFFYTNGSGDTSMITVTTPAHAVGAVDIVLTPTAGSALTKTNAFAYLPTVFTDDTIMVGQTTAKAQHILELRQAVDAMRAVAGLSGAPWNDPALAPGNSIRAVHITDLRTFLDDAATRLGFSTSPYTEPELTTGFVIKRIHIEELRQRIRTIAG